MAVGCDKWEELEHDLALALSVDCLTPKPRLRCSAPGCNHEGWSGNWADLSSRNFADRLAASIAPSDAPDFEQARDSYWSRLEQARPCGPRPPPCSPSNLHGHTGSGDESASEALARQLQAESDADFARHLAAQVRPALQPRQPPPVDDLTSQGAEEFARRLQAECDAEFARQLQEEVDATMLQTQGGPSRLPRPQSQLGLGGQWRSRRISTEFEPLLRPGGHQAARAYWRVGQNDLEPSSDPSQNELGSTSSRSAPQPAADSALDTASVAAERLRRQVMDFFSPASQSERLRQWRPNDQQRRPSHSAQSEMSAFERSVQQNLERRRAIRELWGDPSASATSARSNSPPPQPHHGTSRQLPVRSAAVEAAVRAEALRRRREQEPEDEDYRGIDWSASAWDDWNEIALRRAREAYDLTGRASADSSPSPSSSPSPVLSARAVRRSPPSGPSRMRTRSEPRPDDASISDARRSRVEARVAGLGRQTVVAPFRAPPPGTEADGALVECAICMEKFSDGESLRTLPCLHKYHIPCIDRWLTSNRQCPICKHNVF